MAAEVSFQSMFLDRTAGSSRDTKEKEQGVVFFPKRTGNHGSHRNGKKTTHQWLAVGPSSMDRWGVQFVATRLPLYVWSLVKVQC